VAELGAAIGRYTASPHLRRLEARAQAAAAALGAVPPAARRARGAEAVRRAALASLRLDASPITDATAAAVDAGAVSGQVDVARPGERAGGWAAALKLDERATDEVAAREYANLLAAHRALDEAAAALADAPATAAATLHARVCDGLVDPAAATRPRRVALDVHDGAQGQLLYRGPDPEAVPGLLEGLWRFLRQEAAALPALIVAGVLHERLLAWQPYPAANGRLARLLSRAVLVERGLDPDGLAAPEVALAAEPLAYHAEVAATGRRRGDLTAWLERVSEPLVADLEAAVRELDGPLPAPPARSSVVLGRLAPGEAVTVAEYAADAGVDRDEAEGDLVRLCQIGALREEAGTHGLRLRRVDGG